jgi:hypothetical protein
MSILISPAPTARLCMSKGFRTSVDAVAPYAFTVVVIIITSFLTLLLIQFLCVVLSILDKPLSLYVLFAEIILHQ